MQMPWIEAVTRLNEHYEAHSRTHGAVPKVIHAPPALVESYCDLPVNVIPSEQPVKFRHATLLPSTAPDQSAIYSPLD